MIKGRLRRGIIVSENQFGFIPGISMIKAIYVIIKLMKLYRDRKKDLHIVFINLKRRMIQFHIMCYGSVWKRKGSR